jgi:hypothetical protein
MKDGRTHFAYKVENAVDMKTGAILAAEVHSADCDDTKTFLETVGPGGERVLGAVRHGEAQAVIAWKLDRLFRDCADCLTVTRTWDVAGTSLHWWISAARLWTRRAHSAASS